MLFIFRLILSAFLVLFSLSIYAVNRIPTGAGLYYPTVNTVAGNPNGHITLVEFFDYQCVYCREVPAVLADLIKKNPDLRIVYRDYPILGPASIVAAQTALSAQQQGKYVLLHEALMASRNPLTSENIRRLAKQNGLDVEKLQKDQLTYLTQQQLRENIQLANALNVNVIPVFFVAPTPMSTQREAVEAYKVEQPTAEALQNAIDLLKRAGDAART